VERDRELFRELIEAVRGLKEPDPPVPPDPPEPCPVPRRQGRKEKDKHYCAYIASWLDVMDPE
jgi:hypothetical protein